MLQPRSNFTGLAPPPYRRLELAARPYSQFHPAAVWAGAWVAGLALLAVVALLVWLVADALQLALG